MYRLLRLLSSVCLLAASGLATLLLADAGVRWLLPQRLDFSRPLYQPDERLVFRLRSGLDDVNAQFEFVVRERTNSLGLRDRELGTGPAGGLRILALGDSYGFGHGVELEESYAKRLQEELRVSLDRPVEVVNAGVPAWSLLQELRFLEEHGLELAPDAVLVGLYVGNDLIDSYELFDAEGEPTLEVADGQLVSRKASEEEGGLRGATASLRRWIAPRSHLYTLVRNRSSELLMRLGLRYAEAPCAFFQRSWTPEMHAQWSLTREVLRELRDVTARHGLPLVVLLIPTQHQVHEARWQEYLEIFEVDPDAFDLEQPQRLLTAFCAEEGIDCLDALPPLRRQGAGTPLYFRVDSHLNAAGHAALGELLADRFAARLRDLPDPGAASAPAVAGGTRAPSIP